MSIKTIPAVPAGKEAAGFGPGIARRALGRGMQLPCLCLRLEGDINTAGIIVQVGLLAEHSARAGCPPLCLLHVPGQLDGGYDPHFSDEDAEPREGKTHPQGHTAEAIFELRSYLISPRMPEELLPG